MTKQEQIERLREIIKSAEDCPDKECNNEGYTVSQSREREYITREMAIDGCCPEMEGSLYCDNEWEQVQCQFCYENPKSKFNLAAAISKEFVHRDSVGIDREKVKEKIIDNIYFHPTETYEEMHIIDRLVKAITPDCIVN